ncbi:MAG: hypothetical protein AAF752_05940, partial [Bacteroidota bacterium]
MTATSVQHVATTPSTGVLTLESTTPFAIPDDGLPLGIAFSSRLDAPAGAFVTRVDFDFTIDDEGDGQFYAGDFQVALSAEPTFTTAEDVIVYDQPYFDGTTFSTATDGGYDDDAATDGDIEVVNRTTDAFNGLQASKHWGIVITDRFSSDDGRLASFELRIHYKLAEDRLMWTEATSVLPDLGFMTGSRQGESATLVQTDGSSLFSAGLELALENNHLYWATETPSNSIRRVDLDGSNATTIVSSLSVLPEEIKLDLARGHIYWSDASGDVFRSDLDGSNVTQVLTLGTGLRSFALDLATRHLFWTTEANSTSGAPASVSRIRLDGANSIVLASGTAVGSPGVTELNPADRLLYWSDNAGSEIRQIELSGAAPQTLLSGALAIDFEIDHQLGHLYWSTFSDLNRVNLNGTGVTSGVSSAVIVGIALDPVAGTMYSSGGATAYNIESRGIARSVPIQTPALTPGPTTSLALDLENGQLYSASAGVLWRSDADGEGAQQVLTDPGGSIESLRLDLDGQSFYWRSGSDLQRSPIAAPAVTTLLSDPALFELDVSPTYGELYYSAPDDDAIYVAELDGSNPANLLLPGPLSDGPAHLILDRGIRRKLYWLTDSNRLMRTDPGSRDTQQFLPIEPGPYTSLAWSRNEWSFYYTVTSPSAALFAVELTGLPHTTSTTVYSGVNVAVPGNLVVVEEAIRPPKPDLKVHAKRPATGWGLPRIQYTTQIPASFVLGVPGRPLIYEGCGWYVFT